MRLVQVHVPDELRDSVSHALDDAGVESLFTEETGSRGGAIAYIPVPEGAVEPVLEQLYEAGLDRDAYTIVTDIDRATIPNVDALTDRYVEGPEGDAGISHPRIRQRALDLQPGRKSHIAFSLLSAVVAVGGLLLDSPIAIVGAMVIAPFAGSMLSASVGAVIDDWSVVVQSATSQLLGLAVAILGAVVMSGLLQLTGFVPASLAIARGEQIGTFLTPNVLTFSIAVAAGAAGALALATDLPVSIAGVAVAAAIVPSAATAGIGIVWGLPVVVLGALVLLLMNIVFINLAAYVTLVGLGYRSSVLRSISEDTSVSVRSGALALVVVVFAVIVAATVGATYQHLVFEQAVKDEVNDVLASQEYANLELVTVSTEYNEMGLFGRTETVTVTVARSSDADPPAVAPVIRDEIAAETGDSVNVNVRFVEYQRAVSATDEDATTTDEIGTRLSHVVAEVSDRAAAAWQRLSRVLGRATAGCRDAAVC